MAVTDEMVERAAIAIVNCERTHISLEPITSLEHVLPMDRPFVLEEARAALTAALSLPVSNTGEWQPIETAPKDGSWIIGYQTHKEVQDTVQLWAWKAFGCRDNIWVNAIDANDCDDQPTHWQPLPEAPNAGL